jgi:hypothetical protein
MGDIVGQHPSNKIGPCHSSGLEEPDSRNCDLGHQGGMIFFQIQLKYLFNLNVNELSNYSRKNCFNPPRHPLSRFVARIL